MGTQLRTIALCAILGLITGPVWAEGLTAPQIETIVNAIYWAEGGKDARKPFGILSVLCDGYQDCRAVCVNSVRNGHKRWRHAVAQGNSDTFLQHFSRRWAPIGAANDPTGLNKNWLANVEYFVANPKGIK